MWIVDWVQARTNDTFIKISYELVSLLSFEMKNIIIRMQHCNAFKDANLSSGFRIWRGVVDVSLRSQWDYEENVCRRLNIRKLIFYSDAIYGTFSLELTSKSTLTLQLFASSSSSHRKLERINHSVLTNRPSIATLLYYERRIDKWFSKEEKNKLVENV